jgi:acetyltransferase-like isoleucine patch superfamily enzyme
MLGFNRHVPWPVSPFIYISRPGNIFFHPDDLHNFQSFGIYFQNFNGSITIGKGSIIGPNVGIITANHDPNDIDRHLPGKDIVIGDKCWIGMNSVILPGVILGDNTIVGAGSVVNSSYKNGHCIIAGSPALMIKDLD